MKKFEIAMYQDKVEGFEEEIIEVNNFQEAMEFAIKKYENKGFYVQPAPNFPDVLRLEKYGRIVGRVSVKEN